MFALFILNLVMIQSLEIMCLHLTILSSWDMNQSFCKLILKCAKTNHTVQKLDFLTRQEKSETRVAVTISWKKKTALKNVKIPRKKIGHALTKRRYKTDRETDSRGRPGSESHTQVCINLTTVQLNLQHS